jgi:hypothetical protein
VRSAVLFLIPPLEGEGGPAERSEAGSGRVVLSSEQRTSPHPAARKMLASTLPVAGERDKKNYSAAAARITRHCANNARKAAGLIGLFST